VTEESAALYRSLAEANPVSLPDLARTLNNLSRHYSKVGRVQDAVGPAEESVRLYATIAEREPGFLRDVAMTLSNLGIGYSAIGRYQDAVIRSEEAVSLYRSLGDSLPAFPEDLASALVHLDAHCRKPGVPERAQAAWEEAISGVPSPAAVWLLVARADNVSAGPSETAAWLTRASTLTNGDRALLCLVHQAARRQRSADADSFDRSWAFHTKGPAPAWLTVDLTLGQTATDWISTDTYAAERDYLSAHTELLARAADIAVSEALLMVSKDEANRYTALRAAARQDGVDVAYRLLLLEALAHEFAAADPPRQREMLADHRDDLLTDVVVGTLNEMAGQDDPPDVFARRAAALLDLAASADLDPVLEILCESDQFAGLLHAIAIRPDPAGLLPTAVVAWTAAATPAQSAAAVFYIAAAIAIRGHEGAARVLEQACALDPAQQTGWIDELARIAQQHPSVLGLVPVLTARLDPHERTGISGPDSTEAADDPG
jgi:tetratricopeptide (TPR) repeat protein